MSDSRQINSPNRITALIILGIFIIVGILLLPSLNRNVAEGLAALATPGLDSTSGTVLDILKYGRSIHILAMLLIGFGFLMVFVRKHGFSSMTATYLVVSLSIPLYMLIKSFGSEHFSMPVLSIDTFLFAEFCAASLLIAIGAPLGRLKMDQYIIMGLLFVPAYVFNEWLILESGFFPGFVDMGGSVVIHAFGAYFGLGIVAGTLKKFADKPQLEVDKTSNQFCLLGGATLWLFWPSFTSAIVAPEQVVLTAINTVLALCGATLATYIFSTQIRGKIEIEDIANAALAGGVAIGSTCNIASPGFALLLGLAAGALSTVGFALIAPKVENLIQGTDTCGVHNLHGMPGVLGGIAAILIAGNAPLQLGGIAATVVVAFICGKLTGIVVKALGQKAVPYSDEDEFILHHSDAAPDNITELSA